MNAISFMTANYVARQLGYTMTEGWMQGDNAANAYFRPVETYAARLEEILLDVKALGFDALDLWLAHLHPAWATPRHIAIARDLLEKHGLRVVSLAGYFGSSAGEFEASCRLAVDLNVTILGGMTHFYDLRQADAIALLRQYGLRLGLENHPEKTPYEMLDQIGDGGGVVGTAVDTGWYGTQGYDAAQALEALGVENIVHVHLKDVLAPGAHETCRFGAGCVPLEQCVRVLQRMGYSGAYSIEHEPEHFDPTDDIRASFDLLKGWLSS